MWPASMLIYWNNESFCIGKEVKSHRISLEHQHGQRFIVMEHQYGRCDVCENASQGSSLHLALML